jgi:hypothetical protein
VATRRVVPSPARFARVVLARRMLGGGARTVAPRPAFGRAPRRAHAPCRAPSSDHLSGRWRASRILRLESCSRPNAGLGKVACAHSPVHARHTIAGSSKSALGRFAMRSRRRRRCLVGVAGTAARSHVSATGSHRALHRRLRRAGSAADRGNRRQLPREAGAHGRAAGCGARKCGISRVAARSAARVACATCGRAAHSRCALNAPARDDLPLPRAARVRAREHGFGGGRAAAGVATPSDESATVRVTPRTRGWGQAAKQRRGRDSNPRWSFSPTPA